MIETPRDLRHLKPVVAVTASGLAIGAAVVVSPLIPLVAMLVGAVAVGVAESRARRD